MIGLYITGILIGILSALLLKRTCFRGNSMPFVMELPNYRLPSVKSVLLLMRDKARDFVEKAFTVIFLATIIIWFLQNFDLRLNVVTDAQESLLALIGKTIAPAFAPLGFSDWRLATALLTGFTAKEAVVSTLGILTGTGVSSLETALPSLFPSTLSAVSFLIFTLLYTPCVAAIAAIRRETHSSLRAVGVTVYQCAVAWGVAFLAYRLLSLIL